MDDAGGFAVAKKLDSTVRRTAAAMQNVLNGISMLEVQDGVLSSMGEVVNRMSELKALYHDVMKGPEDRAAYDVEFRDLQVQLLRKHILNLMESVSLPATPIKPLVSRLLKEFPAG